MPLGLSHPTWGAPSFSIADEHFLNDAGNALSESLDENALLNIALDQARRLADGCLFELHREGTSLLQTVRTALPGTRAALQDPAFQHRVLELRSNLDSPRTPGARAVTSRRALFVPAPSPRTWEQWAQSDSEAQLWQTLSPTSLLSVPLLERDRVLGALTLFTTPDSRRALTPHDVRIAEELARKTARALFNAQLYRQATEQRSWLESVLNFVPVPLVLLATPSGRVLFKNDAAEPFPVGLFDMTQDYVNECSGDCFKDNKGEITPLDALPLARVMRGEAVRGLELDWSTAHATLPLSLYAQRMPALSGHSETVILAALDNTQVKRHEAELKAAQERAEALIQQKSEFVANMSHEIRTPLGVILGFAEMLASGNLAEEERGALMQAVRRNAQTLARVIDDVIDFSTLEAKRLDPRKQSFAFKEFWVELTSQFKEQAREKGITFEVAKDTDLPVRVTTDAARLRQILVNVVGNSIKFTERGGVKIHLGLEEWTPKGSFDTRTRLVFTVTDSGPGLTREQQKKLFQPFSLSGTSMARKHGETGIGLIISKRLAQLLQGDVVLKDSVPGYGSTFVVSVDVGEAAIEKSPAGLFPTREGGDWSPEAVARRFRQELQGVKVLVAEDAPDNRLLIDRILSFSGAQVAFAENGQEAYEKAMNGEFDVVLMDIQMPVMDGYAATTKLRKSGYRKPIIALTAHSLQAERDRSLQAGCDDHLVKPINRADLIEKIHRHMTARMHAQVG